MPYLYLVSSVIFVASNSILGAFFNRKNQDKKDTTALYTLLITCSVFVFWVVSFAFDRDASVKILPYSLLFGFCYSVCNLAFVQALKTGPVVITSLILQLSLVAVTVWGFFFWNAKFTWLVGVGLVLIALSLWLCLYNGKKETDRKITLKWLFFVILMFVGNAACTVVQRTQQMKFDGKYANFLMMVATAFSALVCLIVYLKSDKSDSAVVFKSSWYFPVLSGICNAVLNLFLMFMAVPPSSNVISSNVVYPVLAVGGLILTTVFSVFIFKEKMRWWQWIGVGVGIVAVGLLNVG